MSFFHLNLLQLSAKIFDRYTARPGQRSQGEQTSLLLIVGKRNWFTWAALFRANQMGGQVGNGSSEAGFEQTPSNMLLIAYLFLK